MGSIPASGRSPGEGNGDPFPYSCLRNPMEKGAWQCTVHGVAKSQKWLSTGHTKHDISISRPSKSALFSQVSILCHSITVCMPAHFPQFLQCTIFFSTLGLVSSLWSIFPGLYSLCIAYELSSLTSQTMRYSYNLILQHILPFQSIHLDYY